MIVSPHDPALILSKLRQTDLLARINPFAVSAAARVRSRWKRVETSIRHWNQVPLVVDRLNVRVTGSPSLAFRDLVCRDYLADGKSRIALSLGCGDGDREIEWAKRGAFSKLIGLDLSPARIATAQQRAREAGFAQALEFHVADVNTLEPEQQRYDAIIFEHSLHHFANVQAVLEKVRRLLQPEGLLIIDEFIGPRRFQWTAAQLAFADAVLLSIPETYRRTSSGSSVKIRNLRAGELLMWLNDPSEAVESDRIEPEITRQFRTLRRLDYGGTISHLIFHDIAHHFVTDDPDAQRWAGVVLEAEDALLKLGLLKSDFACFVCAA